MVMGASTILVPTTGEAAMLDDLHSYWDLDEVSGVRVDLHSDLDLTDNNTVPSDSGILDNAASFSSAQSEYLSSLTPILYDHDSNTTYNFWVKMASNNEKGVIIEDSTVPNGNNGLAIGVGSTDLDTSGNQLFVTYWGISWQPTGITLGTGWNMITVEIDSSDHANVWKNASSSFTGSTVIGGIANGDFNIGKSNNTNGSPRYLSNALVDEVGVWSRSLTQDEITSLYNDGLGLAYPFTSSTTSSSTSTTSSGTVSVEELKWTIELYLALFSLLIFTYVGYRFTKVFI